MSDTIKLERIDNGNNPNFSAYREIGTPEEEIQYWKVSYEKRTKQNQELKSERDEAREAFRELWQSADAYIPSLDQKIVARWRKIAGLEGAK